MRAFVAINIPLDIGRQLEQRGRLADFQYMYKKMRWLPLDSYHITLRFLGDVSEEKLADYWQQAKPFLETEQNFDVVLHSLLFLPRVSAAKVVAIAADHEPALFRMAEKLESIARSCNFQAEHKKFLPHVSLARLKRLVRVPAMHLPDHLPIVSKVAKIDLMQSHLGPDGAQYSSLDCACLKSGTSEVI